MLSSPRCWHAACSGAHSLEQSKCLHLEGNVRIMKRSNHFVASPLRQHCWRRLSLKMTAPRSWAIVKASILRLASTISGFAPQNRNQGCRPLEGDGIPCLEARTLAQRWFLATPHRLLTPYAISYIEGLKANSAVTPMQSAQHSKTRAHTRLAGPGGFGTKNQNCISACSAQLKYDMPLRRARTGLHPRKPCHAGLGRFGKSIHQEGKRKENTA